MFEVINVIVIIVRTAIELVRLIHDLLKDKKQESNRRPLPKV